MSTPIQQIKQLLMMGKIEEAISSFQQHNSDKGIEKSLISLQGQWHTLMNSSIQEKIDYAEAQIERNKIADGLLYLLETIPDQQFPPKAEGQPSNQADVKGDGNIVIQGFSGGSVSINTGNNEKDKPDEHSG